MFNKFQTLVDNILESNAAGSGGVFGSSVEAGFSPPDKIFSDDWYARGDSRNIFGGVFKKPKKGKKKKSKKQTPLVIRRNLPSKTL
jgi:hypothetical protein